MTLVLPEGLGPQSYPDPDSSFTNPNFLCEFSSTCAVNPASSCRPILFSFGESAWCGAGWRRAASRESPIVRMREFQGGILFFNTAILLNESCNLCNVSLIYFR